jgi:hypothetical protein
MYLFIPLFYPADTSHADRLVCDVDFLFQMAINVSYAVVTFPQNIIKLNSMV